MRNTVRLTVLRREGNREFARLGYIRMTVELYKILEQQGFVRIASKEPLPDGIGKDTATAVNMTSIGLEFLRTSKGGCAILTEGKITEHHDFNSSRSIVHAD